MLEGKKVMFQMDTGLGIFALCFDRVKQLKLLEGCKILKTNLNLKAYNDTIIIHVGVL